MKGQPSLPRRLIRRSWQIVLRTLDVSIPLVCLIFVIKQPNYTASSLLRVEPSNPDVFAHSTDPTSSAIVRYLNTQVQRIKSDRVLEAALANPLVSVLPSVKDSYYPKAELRRMLSVGSGPDGLRGPGGGARADRQRSDRGGVQGACQATAVRLGHEVDAGRFSGCAEPADVELNSGAMGTVLVESRSLGVPGGGLKEDRLK